MMKTKKKQPPSKEENKYSDYVFYCKTDEANHIKGLIELLYNLFEKDAYFQLNENELRSRFYDNEERIFCDAVLLKDNFQEWYVEDNLLLNFSINLQRFTQLLKPIKRQKNRIEMYILKSGSDKLSFKISFDENMVKNSSILIIPGIIKPKSPPDGYFPPILIPSNKFQTGCKSLGNLKNLKKTTYITITMLEDKYIKLRCDLGTHSDDIEFGEELPESEEKNDCYKKQFYFDFINHLSRIKVISKDLEISAPKDHSYPLKISASVGTIGTIDLYLHNMEEINKTKAERARTIAITNNRSVINPIDELFNVSNSEKVTKNSKLKATRKVKNINI